MEKAPLFRALCALVSVFPSLPLLVLSAGDSPSAYSGWTPPAGGSLHFWMGFLFVSITLSVSLLYAWWKHLL